MASKVIIRECKKGEMVLSKKDFPLSQFFVVQKGKVKLMKKVQVETTNYMPTTKHDYEKRSYKKFELHSLGSVHPGQYYGVVECIMGMTAGQVTCTYARAAEDTTLVYFNKHDFVNSFTKDQILEMLDVVKSFNLFKDIPNEELILRTMHRDKVTELCRPRERVLLNGDTPRRIKEIIMDHQERNGIKKVETDTEPIIKNDPFAPKQIPKRNMVVPRNRFG